MTGEQILGLGPALAEFLDEFGDCFPHGATRKHLQEYVRGQLSDLPRKSVEPIALSAGVPPRTLQEFLSLSDWDQDRLRDRMQQIVWRDHADPGAIGVIDESGHVKKGSKTAGVQRQYCGRTGKIDNCVMTVHLTYVSHKARFRTMLDSEIYVPQSWMEPARRAEARIPPEVVYRPKYDIALEQVARAKANGVRFAWITADEWYGDKMRFLEGLEALGSRFVLEIPKDTRGWLHRPVAGERPVSPVMRLCLYSRTMRDQPWTRFHVKDTEKGALVWEAKAAAFWLEGPGGVLGPYWLIVARDALTPTTVKYFVSNASAGTPLEALLHVAFSRWPVERCLEDEKTELGLSHFEVRQYQAVVRHLLLTQVSHLFLMRQTVQLRGEKPGDYGLSGANRQPRATGGAAVAEGGPPASAGEGGGDPGVHATSERQGSPVAHQEASGTTGSRRHPRLRPALLPAARRALAL